LSIDESVWFDNYFYSVICPIFYVETLADLGKETKTRTPEQEVGIIADKFPEMHGTPTAHHRDMAINSLLGNNIPLTGRIPMAGGRMVKSGGRKGVVYDQSPEAEAFLRWQKREFRELEKQFAHVWRSALKDFDQNEFADTFKKAGISGKTCKSLEEAKNIADAVVNSKDNPHDKMRLATYMLDIPRELHRQILERWSIYNYPPLCEYAPYAAHVLTVDIFYHIAIAASLESGERPSNRTDLAYLYYLPFCMVFISSDKLHKRVAKLFLRSNQDFADGATIKKDLAMLNEHFTDLPDEEKSKGIYVFARYPLKTKECRINELWDKHIGDWRTSADEPYTKPDSNPKLVKEMKAFSNAPGLPAEDIDFDVENPDMLSLQRMVTKKKGSWWQLPKDLEVTDDTDQP